MNWRTSTAGLPMVIFCTVDLVFACLHGTADPTTWKTNLLGICTGLGLILARDSHASKKSLERIDSRFEAMDKEIRNGAMIKKP